MLEKRIYGIMEFGMLRFFPLSIIYWIIREMKIIDVKVIRDRATIKFDYVIINLIIQFDSSFAFHNFYLK